MTIKHMYIYTYTCTCTHTHMHTYMHTHMHMCMLCYLHIFIHVTVLKTKISYTVLYCTRSLFKGFAFTNLLYISMLYLQLGLQIFNPHIVYTQACFPVPWLIMVLSKSLSLRTIIYLWYYHVICKIGFQHKTCICNHDFIHELGSQNYDLCIHI